MKQPDVSDLLTASKFAIWWVPNAAAVSKGEKS
jgi:hypothetical protein